jgi:signal transduction histidine kinase
MISWQEFQSQALIRSTAFTEKMTRTIQDSSELWYYNLAEYIELADESSLHRELVSISIFDKNNELVFTQGTGVEDRMTYLFRNPIMVNNEAYGYVEFRESIQQLVLVTIKIAIFFVILGIAIGLFLYRYSVNIVRVAEKDVLSAEQSRRQADRELARLERLRIVGQMAAAIGHEVRNPLTTVRGYLQYFSLKEDLLPLQSQFQLLIDELDRANSIITEFLSMAHNKVIKLHECSLNTLIRELQPLIQSVAQLRGLSVEFDLKNVPNIYVDAKEIKQLVLNITQNGLEAMESEGCLFIKTDVEENNIRLLIIDQGVGIAPDLMPKIGTPFFTTKETGTGLGLAVCYSIAHRHQAKIDFESCAGCTRCIIRFPHSLQNTE